MEPTDVKNNQIDLAKSSTNKLSFNVWAFLLSPLYYFYKGLAGYFILFTFLPVILLIPFLFFHAIEVADTRKLIIATCFLVSHIFAGFVANPANKKYQENYIKKHGAINIDKEVEYFAISVPRLVICTILTSGLYTVYWGFKNWNNYQKTTNDDVNPYLRAWFFDWTAVSLFSNIKRTVKDNKPYVFYGLMCLLIFLANLLTSEIVSKNLLSNQNAFIILLVSLVLMFIYPFCIVPVQKSINKYTTEILKKPLDNHFYPWEKVIITLGIAVNIISFCSGFIDGSNAFISQEEARKIMSSTAFIYKHTKAYPAFCKQENYILLQYPKDFNSFFSEEINNFTSFLNSKGYSLEMAESEIITPQIQNELNKYVYEDLESLRKILIAEKYDIPEENIKSGSEYDSALTLRDTCEFIDKYGADILQNTQIRYFFKNNTL